MKRTFLVGVFAFLAMVVSGCGGGDHGLSLIVTDIVSAGGNNDGEITHDPILTTYSVVTNATADNVFVGTVINPLDPGNPASDIESRGYLTFSLADIPAGASIQSARMLVRINAVDVISGPSVVVLPSMVSFSPLNTLGTSTIINLFNDAEIMTSPVTYDVFPGDIGTDISIDVADPLINAMGSGFSALQIKLVGSFGRIVIDDIAFPPMLRVEYF